MKHTRWLVQMMGLTLILLLLAACASPAPTATPVPPTPTPIPPTPTPVPPVEVEELTVTFEPDHCIYDGPKVIRQGEVTIILNNLTDATVDFRVYRFENGKTWQDLVDHFSEKNVGVDVPEWVSLLSHGPVIGDNWAKIFNLEPGSYAISCDEILQGSWAIWLASPLEVR
jgi:hypothetical protein